jgi:16S rRNA processing protein RimM
LSDRRVILAAIAGAHGVRGEVRLKPFGDSLAEHEILFAGERELKLLGLRPGSGGLLVARFAGIDDRAAAEALRGETLWVPREALPPLGEGEYYHADLIGLAVVSRVGEPLGKVIAVQNFGAGDLLDIERPDGATNMIPFRSGIADLQDGRIVADPAFLA